MLEVSATRAETSDREEILRLYRLLERELVALKGVWEFTEALPDPAAEAIDRLIADESAIVLVGRIGGVPCGFLVGGRTDLLPQAGGRAAAAVRYVFTEEAARGVGVGEAMMNRFLDDQRAAGVTFFDAHVSPGHRAAKNFFESHGFTARHIVMHRSG